jgi:hypothetical protein
MARYHGKRGVLYISTTGAGAAAPVIGQLSEWSIDFTTDKQEVTAMGDLNKIKVAGLKDVTGRLSGFWDNASSDALFTGADSADGVRMYIYPSQDAITKYFYGPAWMDMSIAGSVGGAVTISSSFDANGNWGRL